MNRQPILLTVTLALVVAGVAACTQSGDANTDAQIREDVAQMAEDFLNLRPLEPFPHEVTLTEAYGWQDEMIGIIAPAYGKVVGYKTGGHNPGPANPMFPPGGIRAYLLEGMLREDGSTIRVDETAAGFLEADFAVRVGDAAINDARTDMEILAALDAVVPFAEVPDPNDEPDEEHAVNRLVISNMASRWAYTGTPVPIAPTEEWLQRLNTFEFAVLDENDNVIQSGSMANWYRPITVVRWIRDHLKEHGKELEPGQLLSLGNIGIMRSLYEGLPWGPVYTSNQFRLEYYGLDDDGPATVTINIER